MLIEDTLERFPESKFMLLEPFVLKGSATADNWDYFYENTHERAGITARIAAKEHQTTGGVWRIDMLKCPYFDTCRQYRCAELCACFCDSDDISYSNLHKNLLWKRTKTLGKGGDCCDFCLMIESKAKDKA